ncbi:MAG: Fe-S cluster assembly protein SufD [Blastocatellia bacterium]|jgi:Fe-S cluster assembly protein SufD|nr:Fe-S cluster assembly protein SufD [Blastocatellia bacterium]
MMAPELVKEANRYEEAFSQARQEPGAGEPSWLQALRENSFEQFEQAGFPNIKQEEWKYTNVTSIAKANFAPALVSTGTTLTTPEDISSFIYEEAAQSRLVFVNGMLRHDLSSLSALPDGVVAMDLREALRDSQYEATVREYLEHPALANGFAALNTALFSSGLLLKIPSGTKIEVPIHLLFVGEASAGNPPPAAFPRVLILAEQNSSATIIESYASPQDEGVYLTNAIVDLNLADGARLQHYKIQRESMGAFHVATTRAELGPNTSYNTTTINFGAALSRHDIRVQMDHEGAECSVDGLYMVDGSQHTDTHSVIDHRQPHCTSHQLYKGILDGKSRAVFNGKVFVRHGAQQTDARQTNKNLLLSTDARVDTKPQLEIFADDVKCTHGAAVGQIDEDEMFYLESRGINPALGRNLLTYGFAEEVIERIGIESIRRELDAAVLNRLRSSFVLEG